MFIATANVVHPIPPALKDRMEIISLSGYTPNEKLAIARQFLVPKQVKENGLTAEQAVFDDSGLYGLIEKYTREAGVRNLEREIASVCRKIARKVVAERRTEGPARSRSPPRTSPTSSASPSTAPRRRGRRPRSASPPGLAWTEAGGDVLHIETTLMRGKGNLVLTGQLGDVMQESARAALSYVRSRAEMYGADPDFYEKNDIHVHIPEGAIPKDGPSAGITMATSILSAVTNIAVPQGPRDDRGDHAPREGPSRGRHQGEAPRRLPGRHHDASSFPARTRRTSTTSRRRSGTSWSSTSSTTSTRSCGWRSKRRPSRPRPSAAPAEAGTTPSSGLAH